VQVSSGATADDPYDPNQPKPLMFLNFESSFPSFRIVKLECSNLRNRLVIANNILRMASYTQRGRGQGHVRDPFF